MNLVLSSLIKNAKRFVVWRRRTKQVLCLEKERERRDLSFLTLLPDFQAWLLPLKLEILGTSNSSVWLGNNLIQTVLICISSLFIIFDTFLLSFFTRVPSTNTILVKDLNSICTISVCFYEVNGYCIGSHRVNEIHSILLQTKGCKWRLFLEFSQSSCDSRCHMNWSSRLIIRIVFVTLGRTNDIPKDWESSLINMIVSCDNDINSISIK